MQGRSGRRDGRVQLRRKRRKRSPLYVRALALGGVVCLALSVGLLVRYARMTASTVKTQRELREAFSGEAAASPEPQADNTQAVAMPLVSYSPPPTIQTAGPMFASATQIPAHVAAQATATPEPAMAERFVPLYRRNSDIVGWLKMAAVQEIDFPIVRRDNTFYIDHDFYGRKNAGGTAFLDAANSVLPRDENLIIHAHNMKNGTMFGKLSRMLNLDTLKDKPLLSFDTLYETGAYVPYAVSVVSLDPSSSRYFPLFETNFDTEQARNDYVQGLVQLSAFALPVDVINSDELLTLATCHGNEDTERLVVAYRRLRPHEEQADIEKAIRSAAFKR